MKATRRETHDGKRPDEDGWVTVTRGPAPERARLPEETLPLRLHARPRRTPIPLPPARRPSRPGRRPRTAAPADPGLRDFFDIVAELAVAAVLRKPVGSKERAEPSEKAARGFYRRKAGVNVLANRRHSPRVRSVPKTIRDAQQGGS